MADLTDLFIVLFIVQVVFMPTIARVYLTVLGTYLVAKSCCSITSLEWFPVLPAIYFRIILVSFWYLLPLRQHHVLEYKYHRALVWLYLGMVSEHLSALTTLRKPTGTFTPAHERQDLS